ncbi:unnamed protein product [Agarophyton chilense]
MEVRVLGAGCEVGRSCILVTIQGRRLLLDCGAHPGFNDENRFPVFHALPPDMLYEIDAVLVSHYHFDHAGGVPFLAKTLSCSAPVYMTEPTKDFARLMLLDFVSTSIAREEDCRFTENDVEECFQKVKLLPLGEELRIGSEKDITVKTFYAGHAIGAVMFFIQCAGKAVLYSGDYCVKSDGYLSATSVPFGLNPDIFITEATYCNLIRKEGLFEREECLIDRIVETVSKEGKILIPISALGKAQGICSMLSKRFECTALADVPMFITEGLASKAHDLHLKYSEWTTGRRRICWHCECSQGGKKRSRFRDACQHDILLNLRPFNRNEHWDLLYEEGPMILFATPGNMSTGISHDVFKIWGSHPDNLVIVPSFWFTSTVLADNEPETHQDEGLPMEVRCQVFNQISNVHTDKRGIIRVCKQVQPKSIILVHGGRQKVKQFQAEVHAALNVPCYAPEIGEVLQIASNPKHIRKGPPSCSRPLPILSSEWQSLATSYTHMVEGTEH